MARKTSKGLIKFLDGSTIKYTDIAAVIRKDKHLMALNVQGRQIGYVELSEKDGRTPADADSWIAEVISSIQKDSFIALDDGGSFIRCSAVHAVENHSGRDYRGLIFRGFEDVILSFLPVSASDMREKAANIVNEVLVSFEAGKPMQTDLTEILLTN
ncbi:TPA: hypothetical protein NKU94_003653 [Vibrio parahaemolyticus]|nr:hypothetical protein [Vibrio parahaemolyticus]